MSGVHQNTIHTQNIPAATKLQVSLSTHTNLQWTPVRKRLKTNLFQNTTKHEHKNLHSVKKNKTNKINNKKVFTSRRPAKQWTFLSLFYYLMKLSVLNI